MHAPVRRDRAVRPAATSAWPGDLAAEDAPPPLATPGFGPRGRCSSSICSRSSRLDDGVQRLGHGARQRSPSWRLAIAGVKGQQPDGSPDAPPGAPSSSTAAPYRSSLTAHRGRPRRRWRARHLLAGLVSAIACSVAPEKTTYAGTLWPPGGRPAARPAAGLSRLDRRGPAAVARAAPERGRLAALLAGGRSSSATSASLAGRQPAQEPGRACGRALPALRTGPSAAGQVQALARPGDADVEKRPLLLGSPSGRLARRRWAACRRSGPAGTPRPTPAPWPRAAERQRHARDLRGLPDRAARTQARRPGRRASPAALAAKSSSAS